MSNIEPNNLHSDQSDVMGDGDNLNNLNLDYSDISFSLGLNQNQILMKYALEVLQDRLDTSFANSFFTKITRLLEDFAKWDLPAIRYLDQELNYSQLWIIVTKLSAQFVKNGITTGSKVFYHSPNTLQSILSLLALDLLGADVIFANPSYKSTEILNIFQKFDPEFYFGLDILFYDTFPRFLTRPSLKQIFLFNFGGIHCNASDKAFKTLEKYFLNYFDPDKTYTSSDSIPFRFVGDLFDSHISLKEVLASLDQVAQSSPVGSSPNNDKDLDFESHFYFESLNYNGKQKFASFPRKNLFSLTETMREFLISCDHPTREFKIQKLGSCFVGVMSYNDVQGFILSFVLPLIHGDILHIFSDLPKSNDLIKALMQFKHPNGIILFGNGIILERFLQKSTPPFQKQIRNALNLVLCGDIQKFDNLESLYQKKLGIPFIHLVGITEFPFLRYHYPASFGALDWGNLEDRLWKDEEGYISAPETKEFISLQELISKNDLESSEIEYLRPKVIHPFIEWIQEQNYPQLEDKQQYVAVDELDITSQELELSKLTELSRIVFIKTSSGFARYLPSKSADNLILTQDSEQWMFLSKNYSKSDLSFRFCRPNIVSHQDYNITLPYIEELLEIYPDVKEVSLYLKKSKKGVLIHANLGINNIKKFDIEKFEAWQKETILFFKIPDSFEYHSIDRLRSVVVEAKPAIPVVDKVEEKAKPESEPEPEKFPEEEVIVSTAIQQFNASNFSDLMGYFNKLLYLGRKTGLPSSDLKDLKSIKTYFQEEKRLHKVKLSTIEHYINQTYESYYLREWVSLIISSACVMYIAPKVKRKSIVSAYQYIRNLGILNWTKDEGFEIHESMPSDSSDHLKDYIPEQLWDNIQDLSKVSSDNIITPIDLVDTPLFPQKPELGKIGTRIFYRIVENTETTEESEEILLKELP